MNVLPHNTLGKLSTPSGNSPDGEGGGEGKGGGVSGGDSAAAFTCMPLFFVPGNLPSWPCKITLLQCLLHCHMLEQANPFIMSPVLGKVDPGFLEQSGKPIGHWSAVISHLLESF